VSGSSVYGLLFPFTVFDGKRRKRRQEFGSDLVRTGVLQSKGISAPELRDVNVEVT